jgi:UDP-N-acetyl-D-glucosamine dehydrogenase
MNLHWKIKNTPKIVAGMTSEAKNLAVKFYSEFIDEVIECESIEVAETAKLLENSFRFINISFINELSIFCQKLGINLNEVVNAAATKPYGFMPFYPSIGIGGHCIPVDPLYLANKAREIGAPTRFIDLADQINQEMPGYFVGRSEEKIGGLKGKKVLVIGVSYKPNVADVRETPVEALILGLKNKGAEVFWHDDLVKEWNAEKSVALSNEYDLAIIATPHDYLDLSKLGNVPILNTRGSI